MIKHKREPQNEAEERLLQFGWEFRGISLFAHPQLRGCYTLEQAEEFGFDMYCQLCNSCGVAGCCPPDKCVKHLCAYEEGYKMDYRDLAVDFDDLWFNASMLWMLLKNIQESGLDPANKNLVNTCIRQYTSDQGEFDGIPNRHNLADLREKYCDPNYVPTRLKRN